MTSASTPATGLDAPHRPSDLGPDRPPRADEGSATGLRTAGLRRRLLMSLPDPALDAVLRRSQRPTLPPRATVTRDLVSRERIGAVDEADPGIPVTWIDPSRAGTGAVIHLHGGSFSFGETPAHWRWLEELRRRAGVAGAMVHYRMPPTAPFPAALDETVAVIRDLVDRAVLRDGRWVLSGDGAGGGLALAALQRLRDEHGPLPAGMLLTSPWTDLTLTDPHLRLAAERDEVLSREALQRAAERYAGVRSVSDVRVSPRTGDLHDLPPALVVTGTDDLLAGDARALAAGLDDAGVPVVLIDQEGGQHSYPLVTDDRAAQWALRRQIAFVRRACRLDR